MATQGFEVRERRVLREGKEGRRASEGLKVRLYERPGSVMEKMEALLSTYESTLPLSGFRKENRDKAKATLRVRHVAELFRYVNVNNEKTYCSASAQIGLSRRRCML